MTAEFEMGLRYGVAVGGIGMTVCLLIIYWLSAQGKRK